MNDQQTSLSELASIVLLRTANTHLRTHLNEAEKVRDYWVDRFEAMRAENAGLEVRIRGLEAEIDRLKEELLGAEEIAAEISEALDDARDDNSALMARIFRLKESGHEV